VLSPVRGQNIIQARKLRIVAYTGNVVRHALAVYYNNG